MSRSTTRTSYSNLTRSIGTDESSRIRWGIVVALSSWLLTLSIICRADTLPADFMKGVAYTSWARDEYLSPKSDTTLDKEIKPLGANWISVLVTCYQQTIDSTEISCATDKTPTDAALTHVVSYAHSIGLHVMLKPHVDMSNDSDHWRGQIGANFDDGRWAQWFDSYRAYIGHYAELGQRLNVEAFAIGTELSAASSRAGEWRETARLVRQQFKGPITYAANRNGEEFGIQWWDAVDTIGVDAYYPLKQSGTPTLDELKTAWGHIASRLTALSQRWKRQIVFTEIGYESREGAARPGRVPNNARRINLQEQALCYQAALDVLSHEPWWHGAFWWNWTTDPQQGGGSDTGYPAHGKPAETVLVRYYGQGNRK